MSDQEGRYHFKTIKPGAYPEGESPTMRAPHIHFDISGKRNRLVTQMYFAGESLNDTDRFLATARANTKLLIVTPQPPGADFEPDSKLANFDIVLEQG